MPRRAVRPLSLRTRLVAGLLALVAVGLVAADVALVTALRSYLLDRADEQLAGFVAGPGGRQLDRQLDGRRPPRSGSGDDRPGLPSQFVVSRYDVTGELVTELGDGSSSGTAAGPVLTGLDLGAASERAGRPFDASDADGTPYRVVVRVLPDRSGSVAAALSLADVESTVDQLVLIEVVVSGVVLALVGVLGLALVRVGLRPLERMEVTAEQIAAGDLSRRVPDDDPRTEVGRLGAALNAMLGQIENAFRSRAASESAAVASEQAAVASERRARTSEDRMRRFVADAGHELRTPLTSIRGFAELYRHGGVEDLDRTMRRVEDEAARMGLLVEDLLLLARLDQARPLARAPVDLTALAVDAVHDAGALAPDRDVRWEPIEGAGDAPAVVHGDEPRLRQVVGNLVTNALHHTPAGTPLVLRTGARDGAAVLEVVDRGPGLTPEQASRVFERFYRADPSRSRAHGGSGLGLAIVAALVDAHGGQVQVDTAPGAGATFRVVLPRLEPP